jgi:serine protease Do
VGRASCDDVAVLQFVSRPAGLRAARLGRSAPVRTGDHVTAFGFPGSVDANKMQYTDGKVSAVKVAGTPGPDLPTIADAIQHQAPINPGNSGGPLVNDNGEVVGLNAISGAGQTDNQAFAISADHIRGLLEELESGHSVATLGMQMVPASQLDWSEDEAKINALAKYDFNHRLYVTGVDQSSPAARAGILAGDMVLRINNTEVETVADVCDIAESKTPGDRLRVSGMMIDSGKDTDFARDWSTLLKVRS